MASEHTNISNSISSPMQAMPQAILELMHKVDTLRASRLSDRMAIIRRADIELMPKTNPYERLMPDAGFGIRDYYTAEQIVAKYKVGVKWVWTYTRKHKIPKVRIRQFNYYSRKHIDAVFAKYEVDSALTEWYTTEEMRQKFSMTSSVVYSCIFDYHSKSIAIPTNLSESSN